MSDTKMTEPTTIGGYAIDDYKADDGEGHVGTGSTAENAQAALDHAQEEDAASSYHTDLLGYIDTPKDK